MAVLAFDTHALIKQLKEAGFPELQAEALSEALKKIQEACLGELVTKHDFRELELKIDNKLESMAGELKPIQWMMGVMLAGVVSLFLKAFF